MIAIIAAGGEETRFNSDLPKCFALWNNKTIIEHNIDTLNKLGINKVYVLVKSEKYSLFNNLLKYNNTVSIIKTISGADIAKNCFKAFDLVEEDDTICLVWSDIILDFEIVKEVARRSGHLMNIPVAYEEYPYVAFEDLFNGDISIEFNKDKNIKDIKSGWHDCSFFIFPSSIVQSLKDVYKLKNSKSNFVDLLDSIKCRLHKITNYKPKCYNTLEEYETLVKENN